MIVLTNTVSQTVATNSTVTYNTTVLRTGCGESYRSGTGSVRLRANCATYEIIFSANVSGATAGTPVTLALAISGETLPESVRTVTPAAANDVNTVSMQTAVKNYCGDYDRITVVCTSTESAIVTNPCLMIRRLG